MNSFGNILITHWRVEKPTKVVLKTGIPMNLSSKWIEETNALIDRGSKQVLSLLPDNFDSIFYWVPTWLGEKMRIIDSPVSTQVPNHLKQTAAIYASRFGKILGRNIHLIWTSALSLPKLDLQKYLSSDELAVISSSLPANKPKDISLYKAAMQTLMAKSEFKDIILTRFADMNEKFPEWIIWATNKELVKISVWITNAGPNSIYHCFEDNVDVIK